MSHLSLILSSPCCVAGRSLPILSVIFYSGNETMNSLIIDFLSNLFSFIP
jgi:hypothetical protein